MRLEGLEREFMQFAADPPRSHVPGQSARYKRRAAGMSAAEMAAVEGVGIEEIQAWLHEQGLARRYTLGGKAWKGR